MTFLISAIVKDLRRLRRDPLALVIAVGMPIVLIALVTLVFSGGQASPQGRLLVADEDSSFLSQALTSMFTRDPLSRMLVVEMVKREDGRKRMDRGDASAMLIIPQGFQNGFFQNQPEELQLITNPAQQILPNIIQEALSMAVDGGFYLHRVASDPIHALSDTQRPDDDTVARVSIMFNRLGRSLRQYLDPPLIGLDIQVTAEQRQDQNFASIFLPSMIFMALLFLGNAQAQDLWREKMWGTFRRLATTPVPAATFLLARLLTLGAVLTAVSLIAVLGMQWFAQVPVAHAVLAAMWLILSGSLFYLMMTAIALLAPHQKAANVIGNVVVFPLALLGGSFFPFEMMPAWMARIGRFTPNGWAVTRFKNLVAGPVNRGEFAAGVLAIAALGLIFFLLSSRRLPRMA